MNTSKAKKTSGKGGFQGENQPTNKFTQKAKTYFLTYKGVSDSGQTITKDTLAEFLLNGNPNDRTVRPEKYLICEQMYDSGLPHFHAILVYPKRKPITNQSHYDFLDIHPNIQTMRNMKAALDYVYKEDPTPLTNMDIQQQKRIAKVQDTSSIYKFLYEQMLKDPVNFEVYKFIEHHNLSEHVYKANYSKAIKLLKEAQKVQANDLLSNKPGFKVITRQLIEEKLTPQQLKTYDSWEGYARIVHYLNTIVTQRWMRQQKSMNLLLTGAPSTGKSALVFQRNPLPGRTSIYNHCSVYPMGMKGWFPEYQSDVYQCIYWNEAKLTSYSQDVILQLLDGSPVMLPTKGSSHKKVDNPLIIMTSNMTLDQMIEVKFGYNKKYLQMAKANLAVRVENVIIPPGYNLFLLQKLLVPKIPN